jgi:hypothetical protein
MLYTVSNPHERIRRQLIDLNVASNKKVVQSHVKAKGSNNNLSLWPDKSDLDAKSDGLKTVNTVLKDGNDLLGAPSRLVNSIQQNWLISIICITIILVCILVLYCVFGFIADGNLQGKKRW